MNAMAWQSMLVFGVVFGCAVYATWTLLPGVVRRWLIRLLLRLPMRPVWAAALRSRTLTNAGCHCDGCDQVGSHTAAALPTSRPLVFHPPRRSL
jgi:hypothetical protein